MQKYIAKRVLLAVPTLLGVVALVFIIMRVIPGDVAVLLLSYGEQSPDPAEVEKLRKQLGLDRPLPVQFLDWLWGIMTFDLGRSLWSGEPVALEISRRFPLTIQIALLGMAINLAIAIPIGILCAVRQNTWFDYAGRLFSIIFLSVPSFWLGILVIFTMVWLFTWSPPLEYTSPFRDPWENFQQLIFPALVLGSRMAAIGARMTRSCMLEVLREDYIRTAWAKGLKERMVLWKHALKNALIPVITIIGMEIAVLLGGSVVVETVFTVPGMGRYIVDAIHHRDYPVVQSMVFLMAAIIVLANLTIDLLYGWLNPKLRYS